MGALEGRVAVITGAGRGIGREHALLFAREGARVVVNDLGGANDGSGADAGPAQRGGRRDHRRRRHRRAPTPTTSPPGAARRASCSRRSTEFGRLDVVVNNAGILRDGSSPGMDEKQWDAVIAVHLKGHFAVLRHAAAYWKDAIEGRRAAQRCGDQHRLGVRA